MTLVGMWNALMLLCNLVLVASAAYYAYQEDYAHASFCLLLVLLDKWIEAVKD